jgi:hypothetical protein
VNLAVWGSPAASLPGRDISRISGQVCTKCLVVALARCLLSVTANVRTKAVDRYRRVVGEDHPDTLTCANNLAADL